MNDVDPTKATQLGNIWVIAATLALELATIEGSDAPSLLTMNADGLMESVGPSCPDYEQRLLSNGFVCSIAKSMPVERLAARLRVAAFRAGRVT
jgi:hypothetical protein